MVSAVTHLVVKPKNPAQAFAAELGFWDCVGLLYGRHFRRSETELVGEKR
jgi:hypothetical protein